MNANQLARKVRKDFKNDNGLPLKDNGMKITVSKEARSHGSDVVELGSTYFYKFEASLRNIRNNVEFYADVELEQVTLMKFKHNEWPKNSWATALFRIVS